MWYRLQTIWSRISFALLGLAILAAVCHALRVEGSPGIIAISRTAFRRAAEALLVSAGCIAAGFVVGTAAHFFGGALGFGLGFGALELAAFEGGIVAAEIGLVVGLVIYYAILRGRASPRDWAMLTGVAFITASVTFLPLGVATLLITPVVTIIAAFALGFKR